MEVPWSAAVSAHVPDRRKPLRIGPAATSAPAPVGRRAQPASSTQRVTALGGCSAADRSGAWHVMSARGMPLVPLVPVLVLPVLLPVLRAPAPLTLPATPPLRFATATPGAAVMVLPAPAAAASGEGMAPGGLSSARRRRTTTPATRVFL